MTKRAISPADYSHVGTMFKVGDLIGAAHLVSRYELRLTLAPDSSGSKQRPSMWGSLQVEGTTYTIPVLPATADVHWSAHLPFEAKVPLKCSLIMHLDHGTSSVTPLMITDFTGISGSTFETPADLADVAWGKVAGAELVSPVEVHVHLDKDVNRKRLNRITGTAVIEGMTTVSAPLRVAGAGDTLVAVFPTEIKPPATLLLTLETPWMEPVSTSVTLAAIQPEAPKFEAIAIRPTAQNPVEFSRDLQAEITRLGQAVDAGNLAVLERLARAVHDNAEGLAMTSKIEVEEALLPVVTKLNDLTTSMAAAVKANSADDVRAVYGEIRAIFDRDLTPRLQK